MQLYPAIDIKGGQCVRLTQGLFDNVKVYSDTPADMARLWRDQGATYLHLVDLDGALAGRSVNEAVIRSIVEAVDIPVEIGGGIRSEEAVRHMLELGVARVIIGTKAVERPEFMGELSALFGPERIVAGVDARDGLVAIQGWEALSAVTAKELCLKMKDLGIRHVVYTDISRDGMLNGPNVEATRQLTLDTGLDIIASGGVSSMDDLRQLHEAGIQGAIIGKALYEKRVDLREAVKAFETDRTGE
ncbi:MAG: 1-(5-phosphoribosyl)-5-[(5-phosphoribosylamino)methylideneamino]imidazole-4-carboxamide isomerase [Enterocloster asparagiformis]|nr:1-(5-phosphoribosyl)-5-[(5-phosphoribosylamino)methylideneamino]imidazole-4-carboxamide isomerase [Enterocloster asparagiformis]